MSGMARKATTTSSLDKDVAKELEDALDIDLFVEDEPSALDASSIADFEAQISKAAEDLARDSRAAAQKEKEKAERQKATEAEKPVPAPKQPAQKNVEMKSVSDLRPIEAAAAATPSAFAHANDDRQRDYRVLQQQMRRASPRTIYWLVTLLSLAWVAGGAVMGHMLFDPPLWQVRSIAQLTAAPQLLGLIVAIVVPIILFWGFAVMIRRA